ncbi:MAG TPA: zf-HC2 domain-containing protein [Candidatus Sulfotelmatobacter sp.]|nr:zf-HC2 domain-containing protein [Candidatus Sulfotelmatobacter sp.]
MVNREAMNCEQVWREISNYVDGEVEAGLRSTMDEHFRGCERCKSVLEGTQNVIRLFGDERMMEAPAGFGRRLERRLAENTRASSKRWPTWSTWLIPVTAVLLLAGGLRVANSLTTGSPLKSEHAQQAQGIPPDMLVVVSADAKIFHVAGCDFIHNKDKARTLTAKEAMREGYMPCLRCLRKYLQTAAAGHATFGAEADASSDADVEEEEIHGSGQ